MMGDVWSAMDGVCVCVGGGVGTLVGVVCCKEVCECVGVVKTLTIKSVGQV